MAYEQRDNSGTIFVNDRKEKDTHPDRSGTAMIDGVMYWISGWLKEGPKGKYLSLAFKRKEEQPQQSQAAPMNARAPARSSFTPRNDPNITSGRPQPVRVIPEPFDDEIPF